MSDLDRVLEKIHKKKRYRAAKIKSDPIDGFCLRVVWFTYGVLTGLTIAGIIAGITH